MNKFTRDFVAQTFTPQEQLFLRFAAISIKKQERRGISPFYIRTNEVATASFLNFLEKFYQDHKIEDSNYRVKDTFSHVYTVIKNELSRIIDYKELKQSDPSKTDLTEEQALAICHYAREVWISLSPESFDVYLNSMGNHNTYFNMANEISLDIVGIAKRSVNFNKLNQRKNEAKKKETSCKCTYCKNTLSREKLDAYAGELIDRLEALQPGMIQDRIKFKINLLDK